MLCGCLESPFESSSQNQANGSSLTSSFPGQRRFVKTGATPWRHTTRPNTGMAAITVLSGAVAARETTILGFRVSPFVSSNIFILVTVPAGVCPGQTIQVAAPDGRMVSASVPPGMNPGSAFLVEFPPVNLPQAIVPEGRNPSVAIPAGNVQSAPTNGHQHGVQVLQPPRLSHPSQVPVASPIPLPVPVPPPQPSSPAPSSVASNRQQNMVLVKVPPGFEPGTTLHVQIPGENRMIAAQVPPGVSEFHVAYEPSLGAAAAAAVAPLPVPIPPPQSSSPAPPSAVPSNQQQQKMVLVKVPPGTVPGTTLHVTLPGENRMIAAQVPPGVSEFHVACPPSHGAPQQSQQQRQHQQPGGRNGQNSNNGNGSNRFGSGMGSMIPMVAGGALMGAAGMAMYDHSAHAASNNNAYADNGDAYAQNDYNNDEGYGMGDYDDGGGGFDAGGYDDGGGGFDGGDFGGDF